MERNLRGKVLTVCGPMEPSQLGVVLPHEQPMCDLTGLLKEPDSGFGSGEPLTDLTMTMENLGKIRQYPFSVRTNLRTDSVEDLIDELKLFQSAGGGTVCDISPIGIRLNRESLPGVAQATGLNIIASSSLYYDKFLSPEHKAMTVEEITALLVKEITEGIAGCGVRCGIIGEVGCSSPLYDTERKSLKASVKAQQITGAPIMIHTNPTETSPFEILEELEEANANLSQTAFAHLGRTLYEDENLLRLARKGCYLEFDLFGTECSHYQLNPSRDFPSDSDRIKKVKMLIDNGFSDQILLSSDIHSKHRQARYGGHGYCHILHYVVPKMISRGISKETTQKLITTNPQRWLTFH